MNKKFKKMAVGLCAGIMTLGVALCLSACGKDDLPAGESAYEIAVRHGFVGTEAEWLDSLKGDKGDTGDRGANGEDGDALDAMPDLEVIDGNWYINGIDTGVSVQGGQGDRGKSAYEIWQDHNPDSPLTEEEWLETWVKGQWAWSSYEFELQMQIIDLQFQVSGTAAFTKSITIPEGYVLIVPDGRRLVIPDDVELTVAGTLVNHDAGMIEVAAGGKITVVSGGLFTSKNGLDGAGELELMPGSYFYNNGGMIKDGQGVIYTFSRGATYIDNSKSTENGMTNDDLPETVLELPSFPVPAAENTIKYFMHQQVPAPGDGTAAPFIVLSANAKLTVTKNASNKLVLQIITSANEITKFGTQTTGKQLVITGPGTLQIVGDYEMESGALLEITEGTTVSVLGSLTVGAGAILENSGTLSVAADGEFTDEELTIAKITIPGEGETTGAYDTYTIYGAIPAGGVFEIVGNYVVEAGKTLTVPNGATLQIINELSVRVNAKVNITALGALALGINASLDNFGTVSITQGGRFTSPRGITVGLDTIYGTVSVGGVFEIIGNYRVPAGRTLTVPVGATLKITAGALTVPPGATLEEDGLIIGSVL